MHARWLRHANRCEKHILRRKNTFPAVFRTNTTTGQPLTPYRDVKTNNRTRPLYDSRITTLSAFVIIIIDKDWSESYFFDWKEKAIMGYPKQYSFIRKMVLARTVTGFQRMSFCRTKNGSSPINQPWVTQSFLECHSER